MRHPAHSTTRVRWLLVFWLFVLSAVSFLDRVNLSVAGGSLAASYHLTTVQLGWLFSAFLFGYAAFQTPCGWLADKWGARRVLTLGVVWWGVFTALTASVPQRVPGALLIFFAIRFFLGAGEAVIYPASNQFVARWIPANERGVANGWIFAGVGAGAGLSPPLITYIMTHHGWRLSFWVCAIIGLLAGAVWYAISRNSPAEHPRVSPAERQTIQSGLTLSSQSSDSPLPTVRWTQVLGSKEVWAVTLSYFCFGYVAWIFFSWFFTYLLVVRALNLKASSFYGMLPFIAMAAGCAIGGIISDRLTRWRGPRMGRCMLAAVVITIAAIFLTLGSEVESARLASVVLAGGAGALYLAQSSFWSVTADIAGPSSGSVSGFMNMGAQLGGFVTAPLTPWIANHFGWTASFLVAAGLCVLGASAWLLVDPSRQLVLASKSSSVRDTILVPPLDATYDTERHN
jgi:MFS transporter, ACS family, glucarate transporter